MAWQLLIPECERKVSISIAWRAAWVTADNRRADMELVIWGLLIGLVGMVWLLVAASVQDKESRDEGREREHNPAGGQDQPSSAHLKQGRVKAAA
jgi:hypothetical protein